MNRQQRRQNERESKKDPRYYLSESELNKVKSDAVDTAMMLLLYIPINVMHEKYGWGAKSRLPRLAEELLEEYEKIATTSMPLRAYAENIKKLTGITLERGKTNV